MNNKNKTDDSMIMYASWFDHLLTLGHKNFAIAMIALLAYAFYGTPIELNEKLPTRIITLLRTFTPVIDTNRKKRKGGSKGAEFGINGGRPSTPKGLLGETPMVSRENDDGTATTDTGTVDGVMTGTAVTPHNDADFFVPIFFSRNLRKPILQAEKLVAHYETTGWTLSGGEYLATDAQRIAAAKRWKVTDDPGDRFRAPDLDFLVRLMSAAPQDIRISLASSAVDIHRSETLENKEVIKKIILRLPADVKAWMMSDDTVRPMVDAWRGDHVLSIIAL